MTLRLKSNKEDRYCSIDVQVKVIAASASYYRIDLPDDSQNEKLESEGYQPVGTELRLTLGQFLDKVERIF